MRERTPRPGEEQGGGAPGPDRRAFAWAGWGLALVLAVAAVVQTVRLGAREEPLAGGPPGPGVERGGGPPAAPSRPEKGAPVSPPPPAPEGDFECTQVIGFSQTLQWFLAGFERSVDGDRWEVRGDSGTSIDLWGDPDSRAWDSEIRSPCLRRSGDPDRVVLTVSGFAVGADVARWAGLIERAVAVVREKYPNVEQVVLQPVVGGPGGEECLSPDSAPVRASVQQPFIAQAIAQVAGGDVVAGPVPEVRSCDDYMDRLGHLTDAAAGPIGEAIGDFYAGAGG